MLEKRIKHTHTPIYLQAVMFGRAAGLRTHPLPARPPCLERQRGTASNCKNTYNLPLWVQSWLNTESSLPQEQYLPDSELAVAAALWKAEEKQPQP